MAITVAFPANSRATLKLGQQRRARDGRNIAFPANSRATLKLEQVIGHRHVDAHCIPGEQSGYVEATCGTPVA